MYADTNIIKSNNATSNQVSATITTILYNYSIISIYQFLRQKNYSKPACHSHLDIARESGLMVWDFKISFHNNSELEAVKYCTCKCQKSVALKYKRRGFLGNCTVSSVCVCVCVCVCVYVCVTERERRRISSLQLVL